MFTVIAIMLLGAIIGFLLKEKNMKYLPKAITGFVFGLLLFLGIQVGGNSDIMDNLSTIGVDALIITLGALGGSILLALAVYRIFYKNRALPFKGDCDKDAQR